MLVLFPRSNLNRHMRLTLDITQRVDTRAASGDGIAVASNAVTHGVAFVLEGVCEGLSISFLLRFQLHPLEPFVWVLFVQDRRGVVGSESIRFYFLRRSPSVDLGDTFDGLRHGDA